MATLSLPRIRKCTNKNCNNLGTCMDKKCWRHTNIQYKYPDHFNNPFGIELEFYSDECDSNAMHHVCNDVGEDGSLDDRGVEITVCDEYEKVAYKTAKVTQAIKALGNAWVDRSCGFHIHCNMFKVFQDKHLAAYSQASRIQKDRFASVFSAFENKMFELFSSRRTTYCHKLNGDYYNATTKYSWVNLSGYNSVEVRLHPGTLNPHKILGWTAVCRRLQLLAEDVLLGKNSSLIKAAERGDIFGICKGAPLATAYIRSRMEAPRNNHFKVM